MISNEGWSFILQGAIALGVSLVGIGVKGIYSQLREMNGNVRELQTWKTGHTDQDNERHEKIEKNLDKLWEKIDQK